MYSTPIIFIISVMENNGFKEEDIDLPLMSHGC